MIIFLAAKGHEIAHAAVPPAAAEAGFEVRVLNYTEMLLGNRWPRATYVLSDLDRLAPATLQGVAMFHRRARDLGWRVLNDPARIRSRWGLLRLLKREGLNSFNAYRVEEGLRPERWPVFVRTDGGHDAPDPQLLFDWDAVQRAIEAQITACVPVTNLLIVEFAGEPVLPGLYRKLSSFRIGDRSVAHPCVHEDNWVAKHGTRGIAPVELYEEELSIVAEDPYREPMRQAFELAQIDYGRSDFGIVGGRIELYEINLNPRIEFPEAPVQVRREAWALFRRNYIEALRSIDT